MHNNAVIYPKTPDAISLHENFPIFFKYLTLNHILISNVFILN